MIALLSIWVGLSGTARRSAPPSTCSGRRAGRSSACSDAVAPLPDRSDDSLVVGSGPNGLAAGITLAAAGRPVTVLEGSDTVGGGCRSEELTLPGFVHDTCSTVHALALASPFLSNLPLEKHGLELVHPDAPLAHPLDDGSAVMLERSVEQTASGLGPDGSAYRRLLAPLVRDADKLVREILGPIRPPRHPLVLARFGPSAVRSAVGLARSQFAGERARALLAGCCAHSMLSLRSPASAAFGLVLALSAHRVGWPVARGGSQRLADALAELELRVAELERRLKSFETQEEAMDRKTKERKLVALMLNDMGMDIGEQEMVKMNEEVAVLPDEELNRTLASRLELPDPTGEEELESALRHVEDPERLSEETQGGFTGAPDMSHEGRPEERES